MSTGKEIPIQAQIQLLVMKEGDFFICYSPALELVAHGKSYEDAHKSFIESLDLYIEYVTEKGTWKKVLQEYGWKKVKDSWAPPEVISHESRTINIPASV